MEHQQSLDQAAKVEEEDLRQTALAVAVGHQTRAVAEEVGHRKKAMVEEAEGGFPKKLEHSVLVLVSWAVEVAMGWRGDSVDQAKAVVGADQRKEVVRLDL